MVERKSRQFSQLEFTFAGSGLLGRVAAAMLAARAPLVVRAKPAVAALRDRGSYLERDGTLSEACADLACKVGHPQLARQVEVCWNRRLVSSAGLADFRAERIELNPRLRGQSPEDTMRTLKHELAHLVAHARAGRRRIRPHGAQWRRACAELGIAGEKASHSLPLAPHRRMRARWSYSCPCCGEILERVRRMRHISACLPCCRK
ncbi:MAG: SprT-like domain-containing protein, partial [Verrucomicrobiales bacterium]